MPQPNQNPLRAMLQGNIYLQGRTSQGTIPSTNPRGPLRSAGVDFGTTGCRIAAVRDGSPEVLPNVQGSLVTPSFVAWVPLLGSTEARGTGEWLIGNQAKSRAAFHPDHTVQGIKRKLANDEPVRLDGRECPPEEIAAQLLIKLKADVEMHLNQHISDVVVSVPASFNYLQRDLVKRTAELAGWNVLRLINEATLAAVAYGLERFNKDETILFYDLGGGTFDVTVVEFQEGLIEVRAMAGDAHLGGDDFDERVTNYLADAFQRTDGIDLRQDPQALQRLKEAVEKAKIELSSAVTSHVNLPFITADQNGPKHLIIDVTRAKFQEITQDLLERTRVPFMRALEDAGVKPTEIDEVVLVGGSTRMPAVAELVKQITGKTVNISVNPDEAVAIGAAVQAHNLAHPSAGTGMVLVEVTSLSLGVETAGGVMTHIIKRNTAIPHKATKTFTTDRNNQDNLTIKLFQGESPLANENQCLGTFDLFGIPPAPRGVPKIEVILDIDANGILNLIIRESETGQEYRGTLRTGRDNLPVLILPEVHEGEPNKFSTE